MDRVGAYSAYQKMYTETLGKRKAGNEKKAAETDKLKENEKVSGKEKTKLSDKARELLKELQKKYGNMDFIIADYETEEEASALLARGTKEFSVLIEPELLEQMAADEEVKAKYMGIIEESTGQLADMKAKLEESGEEVTHMGVSIGEDGTVKFFAKLEEMNEKQRERIQNAKEERIQNAKEERKQEKKEETKKSLYLEGDSIEELLEKIRTVDWSKVEEKPLEVSGSKIDYSI